MTKKREIYNEKSYLFGLYKRKYTTYVTEKEYERLIIDKKMNDTLGIILDVVPLMIPLAIACNAGNILKRFKRVKT